MTGRSRIQSTHSGDTRPSQKIDILELWILFSFGACALLPILLATSARPTSLAKNVQAGIFLAVFLTALPLLLGAASEYISRVLLVYGLMALFFVPAIIQGYFDLEWVIGDILLLSVPALLGIALQVAARRRPNLPRIALRLTVASLMVAAIVGSYYPDAADHNRYAAPAPLLMVAVWVYFFSSRGARRLVAFAAVGVVAVLTWNSQWRSSALVFAFVGIVVISFLLRGFARFVFPIMVAVVGILVFGLGVSVSPWAEGGSQSNSRFLETFESGGSLEADSSTMFRFTEADAVVATVRDEWAPPNYLVGGGHGATYNLDYLESLPGSARFEERNGRDGRVHNIHLGALLVAYRYGLLGVAIVLYILARVGKGLVSAGRRGLQEADRLIVTLGFIGCALLHLANNVTTNIHFTLTAALLIGVSAGRSAERCELGLASRGDSTNRGVVASHGLRRGVGGHASFGRLMHTSAVQRRR